MNPEAPAGPSQHSTSSSSFQAQFPNQSQNLPFFSATVKFPMTSPVPFQCVIGLQPLNPYFYPFYPSSSTEGCFSQNPTGPSNLFGSNVVVADLSENNPGVQDQNECNIFNGLVERCVFSNQQLDPVTKKCPLVNCVCQGPNGNHIGNGGAKTTNSSSHRNIQNYATQTTCVVRAIEGAKNSGVQAVRCSAFKSVGKGLPEKSGNEIIQGHKESHKESDETMQQTEDPRRMEKEPKKSRASIPKLVDIAEKNSLHEAAKIAILVRPRARGMFAGISGKTSEKDEEIVEFSGKLANLKNSEDKEVDEPVKKRKKPGPKPKKHY